MSPGHSILAERPSGLGPVLRARFAAWLGFATLVALLPRAGVTAEETGRMAAATEHPLSTAAAIGVMRAGGNAVDAAIASTLVAGVVNPSSSGLGGGGFALVWKPGSERPFLLDFRETAGSQLQAADFEKRPFARLEAGRYVGVPGEVAGLVELHARFGVTPWVELVAPAQRYARRGFPVGEHLGQSLASSASVISTDPGMRGVFFPGGHPAPVGRQLRHPRLAETLQRITTLGRPGFYEGPVADDIVKAVQGHGGVLELSDLDSYSTRERAPLHVRWDGRDIFTMPPPSAGGLMLAQTLKLYSKPELRRLANRVVAPGESRAHTRSGAYQHALAEAMRGALADRMRVIGDPDFEQFSLVELLSDTRMARRKALLQPDLTHRLPRFGQDEHGTHHLVVADSDGMVVSLTTTVNRAFGAKFMAPASGVILNDELDDFTSQVAVVPFGLTQSPNRPRAGARPVSSMTPTIVVRAGRAELALGGSGGMTIGPNVTQLAVAALAFDHEPVDLVAAPRFFIPASGATILLEAGAEPALVEDLQWRGENVGTMPRTKAAVQVIKLTADGRKRAAADPRKHGSAKVADP